MFITTSRPNHRALTRPFGLASFDHLLRELDHFDKLTRRASTPGHQPRFAWKQHDDHYLLQGLVPGLREEDLDLQATAEGMTLRVSRKLETPEGFQPLHRERSDFSFSHTWRFPEPVNLDQIQASLDKGVLTVKVPRRPEPAPRQIKITVS